MYKFCRICVVLLVACFSLIAREESAQAPRFPQWDFYLSELESKARELEKYDRELARELGSEIKERIKEDSSISQLEESYVDYEEHSYAFEYNRAGRDMDGVSIGASEISVLGQQFICSRLPRNAECASRYWDIVLRNRSSLLVSLHASSERADEYCVGFWKEPVLSELELLDNWTVQKVSSEVIAFGKPHERGVPVLIETTLKAENGEEERCITHLHYNNWFDHTAVPDEEVFQIMLNRMHDLDDRSPIVINCIGGVGRTGAIAAAYLLEREVDRVLFDGTDEEYRVNLAELIYEFRRQRPKLLGNHRNYSKICSAVARYYEEAKRSKN